VSQPGQAVGRHPFRPLGRSLYRPSGRHPVLLKSGMGGRGSGLGGRRGMDCIAKEVITEELNA
jgi:hypothetical protein